MASVAISNGARWVITLSSLVLANWDQIARLFNRADELEVDLYGYVLKVVFEFRESSTGIWQDRGEFGVHWVNTTGGDVDTTWTNGDFAAIEAGAAAFLTSCKPYMSAGVRAVEYRWYPFGPGITGTKAAPNPVYRVTPIAVPIVGTATGGGPRQTACAFTLKTPLRLHWGRFYLPMVGSTVDAYGRIPSTGCDALAGYGRTFLKSGEAQGVYPGVWDHVRKTLYGATDVQVDDVPDIIRRRRPSVTAYRAKQALA